MRLAWVLLISGAALAGSELDPKRTYAVVVGVLKWQDSKVTSFPAKDRKDRELHEALHSLGVPKANTALLLDGDATLARIKKTLERIAKLAPPGSTLLFYYAGHGVIAKETIEFLNYDHGPGNGLSMPLLAEILGKSFRGDRVLLMADCCHSGGLARVAATLARRGKRAASLTSAARSNISTGNWTFTMTILDGFRGEPIVDADRDGAVTLAELAREVADAMKHRERQRYGYATFGVAPGLRLAAARKGTPRRPEYVEAKRNGKWQSGRILDEREGKYAIQFQGYSDRDIVWLPKAAIRKHTFKTWPAGTDVEVRWGGRIWKARILEVEDDFHKITYPGWSSVWDEWVLDDRIVPDVPEALPGVEALKKASVGGKYRRLLEQIEAADDYRSYGAFHENGHSTTKSWAGHRDLPPGYWVYVYPCWYIWGVKR